MSNESYVSIFGEVFSYTEIRKNERIIEQIQTLIERDNQYRFVGEEMVPIREIKRIMEETI